MQSVRYLTPLKIQVQTVYTTAGGILRSTGNRRVFFHYFLLPPSVKSRLAADSLSGISHIVRSIDTFHDLGCCVGYCLPQLDEQINRLPTPRKDHKNEKFFKKRNSSIILTISSDDLVRLFSKKEKRKIWHPSQHRQEVGREWSLVLSPTPWSYTPPSTTLQHCSLHTYCSWKKWSATGPLPLRICKLPGTLEYESATLADTLLDLPDPDHCQLGESVLFGRETTFPWNVRALEVSESLVLFFYSSSAAQLRSQFRHGPLWGPYKTPYAGTNPRRRGSDIAGQAKG